MKTIYENNKFWFHAISCLNVVFTSLCVFGDALQIIDISPAFLGILIAGIIGDACFYYYVER